MDGVLKAGADAAAFRLVVKVKLVIGNLSAFWQTSKTSYKRPVLPWLVFLLGICFHIINRFVNRSFVIQKHLPLLSRPHRWNLIVRGSKLSQRMKSVIFQLPSRSSFEQVRDRFNFVRVPCDHQMSVLG